jgi:hypothetical protein
MALDPLSNCKDAEPPRCSVRPLNRRYTPAGGGSVNVGLGKSCAVDSIRT